jgi:hypothetical protein
VAPNAAGSPPRCSPPSATRSSCCTTSRW